MTCIVWDGKGRLAADRNVVIDDVSMYQGTKIAKAKRFLFGVSGTLDELHGITHALSKDVEFGPVEILAIIKSVAKESNQIILIDPLISMVYINPGIQGGGIYTQHITHPVFLGSYREYARGAYLAGANATEAVKAALNSKVSLGRKYKKTDTLTIQLLNPEHLEKNRKKKHGK